MSPGPRALPWLLLFAVLAGPSAAAEAASGSDSPRLKIGGFGDFNFEASNEEGQDSNSGFEQGQFVLHFVSALSERIRFFGEVSLSARDTEFKTEVERAIVKFELNDRYKLSFGRFHSPTNWWNTAFHHGQWLQTTVGRPEMTRFGGEFIPVHFVGGVVEGAIPSGALGLYYEAGIGNGRSENIARGGDAGDVNNNRAWLARLSAKPARPYGLQAGLAHYRDRISRSTLPEDFRESIASAFVIWNRETPEVLAEYARIERDAVGSGGSFDSDAYYVQLAYRIRRPRAGGDTRFKPYGRYERIEVDDADPVFVTQTDRRIGTIGLRVDASLFLAVKVEYRRERTRTDPWIDAGHAQVSFTF